MHTVTELETSVPAFLGKLWKLVEDPETDDLICWSPNGRSFFIRNPAQFARELLPHYYKHNNMASFVRQLNMYGFHKKVSVELGGLKCERDEMEFAHQYFIKDHPYLLEHIKRKIANKSQDTHLPMKSEMMNKVLSEVRTMRGRQEHLDTRLGAMKRENEALWRELAMLRRKHLKQQDIVNKLIHFLVTLVQPGRGGGLSVKRRYPLMIDNHQRSKHPKMSKPEASPTGPTIHELDGEHEHDLNSQYIVAEMLENHTPAIQSPASIETELDDDNTETIYHTADETVDREIRLLQAQEEAVKKQLNIKPKKKQETLLLDVNPEEPVLPIALLENKIKQKPKAVPLRTVRSSKLTAMAANINKMNSGEESEVEEPQENADVDLNDILIIPEVTLSQEEEGGPKKNGAREPELGQAPNVYQQVDQDPSSSAKSKDLSLSRVNPSGTEANYRLGSMEEMDNHLETMQNELDNLRDILRGEGYSIDANTLLGLFGGDDPMSFGIPMNPELNPNQRDRDDDDHLCDNTAATGGELMAYNPTSSLLDFDDDIFGVSNPSINSPVNPASIQNFYSPDPLGLEDSKGALLEALAAQNNANSSTSS
ncbi:heat shock factor protein isoform X2 [Diachasma alloeum]|uniref:heat shock factor protein isoform X2 n=1 Tax=Diachasma alloeum TaxID=454923 RepID=UPI000738276F|nr:heat shock factor protein isoform X2 [Diachasma alloeum]